jgi:hybrid cluster-associated redox disulfide protein
MTGRDKVRSKMEPASAMRLTMDMTMDVVMAEKPECIPVLLANKMHCVGCLLAPFHDIGDAAREHELDADHLLSELRNAAPRCAAAPKA